MTTTTVPVNYQALTNETAEKLAKHLNIFPAHDILIVKEIGDGNLNLVFHLSSITTKKSIIIKQALPYAKILGESWPLTLNRAEIEANALIKHGEFVPEFVPTIYHTNKELAITVMEDLSHLTIAREGLTKGQNYPLLAKAIGTYLGKTSFYTSDYYLNLEEKQNELIRFSNPELSKITEGFVFSFPFFNNENNDIESGLELRAASIWQNDTLKHEVLKLTYKFFTETQALLHGDLHTGSIFAGEEEIKVFDSEFACYGPIGFDLGHFIANITFQVISREETTKQTVIEVITDTWHTFANTFTTAFNKDRRETFSHTEGLLESILENVLQDAFGFAGCELIRRTIGLAHVKDLESIENTTERLAAKEAALSIGEQIILQRRQMKHINDYITVLQSHI